MEGEVPGTAWPRIAHELRSVLVGAGRSEADMTAIMARLEPAARAIAKAGTVLDVDLGLTLPAVEADRLRRLQHAHGHA